MSSSVKRRPKTAAEVQIESQMDELSALFDVADFNNDGSVDKYELSGALKSIGILDKTERALRVTQLMSVLDKDGDGMLSRDEFMALDPNIFRDFLTLLGSIREEDAIQGMIEDIWDSRFDEDGEIEEKELVSLVRVYAEKNTEESVATARRLMELLDVRGNGMLRREDFTVDSACLEVYAEFSSNLPMDGATFNAAHGSVPRLDAGDPFSTSAAEGGQDQAPPMMTPGTRMQLPAEEDVVHLRSSRGSIMPRSPQIQRRQRGSVLATASVRAVRVRRQTETFLSNSGVLTVRRTNSGTLKMQAKRATTMDHFEVAGGRGEGMMFGASTGRTGEATEDTFNAQNDVKRYARKSRSVPVDHDRAQEISEASLQHAIASKARGAEFNSVTEEKICEMHMLFDLNDTRRSNSIGLKEFKRIVQDPSITGMSTEHMTDTYISHLFEHFDPDEDGELDFENFLLAFEGAIMDSKTGIHTVSPAFHAASHKALVNEKVELQRSMLAMQTNYAREISESKGLANEVEDMMTTQAQEFDESTEKSHQLEVKLRGQVKSVTSALEEASSLVEQREAEVDELKSELSRLRKELQDAKGVSGGNETMPTSREREDSLGSSKIAIAAAAAARIAQANKAHQEELNRYLGKIEDLHDELAAERSTAADKTLVHKTETAAAILQEQSLKDQLAASEAKAKAALARAEKLQSELAASQAKVGAATKKGARSVKATRAAASSATTTTAAGVAKLKRQLAASETENTALRKKVAEFELTASQRNAVASELRVKLTNAKAKTAKLERMLAAANATIDSLEHDLLNSAEATARAEAVAEQLRQQLEISAGKVQLEADTTAKVNAMLETAAAHAEEFRIAMEELNHNIAMLKLQLAKSKAKLAKCICGAAGSETPNRSINGAGSVSGSVGKRVTAVIEARPKSSGSETSDRALRTPLRPPSTSARLRTPGSGRYIQRGPGMEEPEGTEMEVDCNCCMPSKLPVAKPKATASSDAGRTNTTMI